MGEQESFKQLKVSLRSGGYVNKTVFIKPYVGDESLPEDKTLFVSGLSGRLRDPSNLRQLFGQNFGQVEEIALHPNKNTAMVLFKTPTALSKALKAHLQLLQFEEVVDEEEEKGFCGLRKIIEDLKSKSLPWEIAREKATKKFQDIQAKLDEQNQQDQQQQDDGWTVVKKGRGRKRVGAGYETSGVSAQLAEKVLEHKNKKQKVSDLSDFYKFQKREERMSQQFKLIKKFEQDKQRIKEQRNQRLFKPV
eukprot:TRINITY_DN11432_c0_g1_i1.p1 TRINITY_DN11432_c0_g1~~TRINITY_DN11432_c0_g1_i1.p1  ORF type:complete len:292 (+),score=41.02 TRINITY_DN11432_c0_g1_i1:132-878(+)